MLLIDNLRLFTKSFTVEQLSIVCDIVIKVHKGICKYKIVSSVNQIHTTHFIILAYMWLQILQNR